MSQIRTEQSGRTATLIIDNPERRNAMNSDMYRQVPGAGEFPTRPTGDEAGRYDSSEHLAWRAIESIPVPVIASIHGPCVGGGLVDEMVEKEDLDSHTVALAERIGRLSPLSIRAAKLTVDSIERDDLTAEANMAAARCYASSDFRQGIQAFLDKRRPMFEGR